MDFDFNLIDSIIVRSANENGKIVINNLSYENLIEERKKLEQRFKKSFKESPNELLFYRIINPMKVQKNKFSIDKDKLNDLFKKTEDKRIHKEIYNSKIYELADPVYLARKKYIPEKYGKLNAGKNKLKQREYDISRDKYYDKKNNIYMEFAPKDSEYNKIKNKELINNSVKNHDILVRIKNDTDDFDKSFLLRPVFTMEEIKSLILFIYKAKFNTNNPGKIYLYYYDDLREIMINDDKKRLIDLTKEMNNKYYVEISFFIE